MIQIGQKDGSAAKLAVEQGRRQLHAAGVEIMGPSTVVSVSRNGQPAWMIETRASVKLLLNKPGQVNKPTKRTQPDGAGLRPPEVSRKAKAEQVRQFHQAIRQRRKVEIRYRAPQGQRKYTLIPLDVKGGTSERTRRNRYMWAYSETGQRPLAFRLDRVVKVKPLPDTGFDPAEVAKAWSGQPVKWNLPRKW